MADGDFRLNLGFVTHRKTEKARRLLGDTGPWSLVCLFSDVAQHHPSGDLSGFDSDDIAAMARWPGEADLFVRSLVACKWLDGGPGTYRLHDWAEHQPWIATAESRKLRAKGNAAKRWEADASGNASSMLVASKSDASSNAPFLSFPILSDPRTPPYPLKGAGAKKRTRLTVAERYSGCPPDGRGGPDPTDHSHVPCCDCGRPMGPATTSEGYRHHKASGDLIHAECFASLYGVDE